jgi:hypothetical protein
MLAASNDPSDEYHLPMHEILIICYNIMPATVLQLIHIIVSSLHFIFKNFAISGATFRFCRAVVDVIKLGFNSMGALQCSIKQKES